MPGKFVVKKGTTEKFRFNLLSTNGQVGVVRLARGIGHGRHPGGQEPGRERSD